MAETEPAKPDRDTGRKKSMIYTKTGDKGSSSLYTGERRHKTDPVFSALGDVDELNAHVGVAREWCAQVSNGLESHLELLQSVLLDVGSAVATPNSDRTSEEKKKHVAFDPHLVELLEEWIDTLDEQLPPLRNFILPSGGMAASHLHVARTVCRRAERSLWPLVEEELVDDSVAKFVNRLSDFFFVAARFAAMKESKVEVIYKKQKPKE